MDYSLNDRLIEVIQSLGFRFPIARLSKDLGYNSGIISEYYNKKKVVSEKFLRKFCEVYGLDYDKTFNNLEAREGYIISSNIIKQQSHWGYTIDEMAVALGTELQEVLDVLAGKPATISFMQAMEAATGQPYSELKSNFYIPVKISPEAHKRVAKIWNESNQARLVSPTPMDTATVQALRDITTRYRDYLDNSTEEERDAYTGFIHNTPQTQILSMILHEQSQLNKRVRQLEGK